jgi:hypothetical protein
LDGRETYLKIFHIDYLVGMGKTSVCLLENIFGSDMTEISQVIIPPAIEKSNLESGYEYESKKQNQCQIIHTCIA